MQLARTAQGVEKAEDIPQESGRPPKFPLGLRLTPYNDGVASLLGCRSRVSTVLRQKLAAETL